MADQKSLMVTGEASSQKIPSVDPETERAAVDVVRDPDAYFVRQRAICELEAEEYVESALARADSARSRTSIRTLLSRLSPG